MEETAQDIKKCFFLKLVLEFPFGSKVVCQTPGCQNHFYFISIMGLLGTGPGTPYLQYIQEVYKKWIYIHTIGV